MRPVPLLVLLLAAAFGAVFSAAPASGSAGGTTSYQVLLPFVVAPPPLPPISWDARLDQRGTFIVPAEVQPGQGYWRLVKGVWYAEHEQPFDGQHHIYMDSLDAAGQRRPGVPIDITSMDGKTRFQTVVTELKPGDLYAGNFPMYSLAPAYRALPNDGNPADAVSGMGMGSIEYPYLAYHTSYGFVWQWTIAPEPPEPPSPTATPEATPAS